MELELIYHIFLKLERKEIIESFQMTEQYRKDKNKKIRSRKNVGRNYEIIVQDIENLKRQYVDQIPEKFWDSTCFGQIYYALEEGKVASLPAALKYVEEHWLSVIDKMAESADLDAELDTE